VVFLIPTRQILLKQLTRPCASAGLLLSLNFDPEDGYDMFLRKIGLSPNCTTFFFFFFFFFFFSFFFLYGAAAHIGPWPPLMRFRNLTLIDGW
jgi:hypothetical protein